MLIKICNYIYFELFFTESDLLEDLALDWEAADAEED